MRVSYVRPYRMLNGLYDAINTTPPPQGRRGCRTSRAVPGTASPSPLRTGLAVDVVYGITPQWGAGTLLALARRLK